MKKILMLIFLPIILFAQPYQSNLNSTTTLLDSAATYTGTTEEVSADYTWIVVTVRSDQNGTGIIQWAKSKIGTIVWDNASSFTHTANDTTNNRHWFPITEGYFRIKYTNDTTDQTSFRLTTTLFKGNNTPLEDNKTQVKDTASQNSLDDIETNTDSIVVMTTDIETDIDSLLDLDTQINGSLDNIEADADSTVDKVTEIDNNTDLIETKLDSIDASTTRIEGYADNIEPKLDSIEVSLNNIETNAGQIEVKLDSLDASNTRLENYTDNIESKQDETIDTVAAQHASIVAIQNLLASDSLTVQDVINLKNLLTQIYNKLNSDSLTVKDVLGIKQNQINGSQTTKITDGSETAMIDNGATYDGFFVRLTDGTNVSSLSGTGDLEVSGDAGAALATNASVDNLEGYLDNVEVKQDTANARIDEIKLDVEAIKQNQTDGDQVTSINIGGSAVSTSNPFFIKAANARFYSEDSLVNKDTVSYNFSNNYGVGYIRINNRSGATVDTFAVEVYSDLKNAWTSNAIGLSDELTGIKEANNALIIVAISTEKAFKLSKYRPGNVRIRTLTTRARTSDVAFEGINP